MEIKQENKGYFIESDTLKFDYASWDELISQSVYTEIKSASGGELIVLVKFYNDFFEVKCKSLPLSRSFHLSGLFNFVDGIQYLSHKFNMEIMKVQFREAIHRPKDYLHICQIRNLAPTSKSPKLFPMQHIDENEGLELGYPEWSFNEKSTDILCSISISKSRLIMIVPKVDFTPKYNTDRDGGWFVYTHEQYVIGIKDFETIYDLQSFLLSMLKRIDIKCDFSLSDVYNMILPIEYAGRVEFKKSVHLFFQSLGIFEVGTIYKTFEENVDKLDDKWIPVWYGGRRGPWTAIKYPYGFHTPIKRKYSDISLVVKYVNSIVLQKKLNQEKSM